MIGLSRPARIALIIVWAVLGLFVLADLFENVRGDSYLMPAVPYDFLSGAAITAVIVGLDRLFGRRRRT